MTDSNRDEWRQAMRERREEWRQYRRERWRGRHGGFGGLLIGTILAGIGVLLLLQNLGVFYVDDLWEYWPVILIVLGVSKAATAYGFGGRIWGGAIFFVGTLFLLKNLGFIYGNVWNFFWPVILICLGLGMLVRHIEGHNYGSGGAASANPGSSAGDRLTPVAIFSGAKRRIESQEFEGGEATAIFGGVELDLRNAGMKKDEIVIEATAIFGGIEIRVPENWKVTLRGNAVFGGYEDKTMSARSGEGAKQPHLIITGDVIFGGVTVRN